MSWEKLVFFIAALGAAFLLGGCDTLRMIDPFTDVDQVVKACSIYELNLTILAELRNAQKLKRGQVETVEAVRRIVNPVCQTKKGVERKKGSKPGDSPGIGFPFQ